MELNREPRNKPTHMWSINVQKRRRNYTLGKNVYTENQIKCPVISHNGKNMKIMHICVSVQFSRSVVSDSLWHYESQYTRPPCPSPTPRVYSNSCPSSLWCHPAILSSVVPFSSYPQSLPASGSFSMSQLFACGGQSTGVSVSASVLPGLIFRMDCLDLLAVHGTLKSLLQHHSSKASIYMCNWINFLYSRN